MAFSFTVTLSLPFILPDCSTWMASRTADAPRGMMMAPSTITGSSTTALNVIPALEESTSIASVSRTFTPVPAGTVTIFGAAGFGRGRRGGRGWGRRLPWTELDPDRLGERDFRHLTAGEEDPHGPAVAAHVLALDHLAGLEADLVGQERRARAQDQQQRGCHPSHTSSVHGCSVTSLDDGQGGRDLQIDDQLQLVLDLQEPQARARRQRLGEPFVVLRLHRVPLSLPGRAPESRASAPPRRSSSNSSARNRR